MIVRTFGIVSGFGGIMGFLKALGSATIFMQENLDIVEFWIQLGIWGSRH